MDVFSSYGGVDRFLWIGLNDAEEDGTWVWASGEPVDYVNWWTWEPNFLTPEEDYVQMLGASNNQDIPVGYWNDIYDDAWPYKDAASGHNFGPVFGVVEVISVPDVGTSALLLGLALSSLAAFRRRSRV